MSYRWNAGFMKGPAYFVMFCAVIFVMMVAASSSYGEDFDALKRKADRGRC